MGVFNQTQTTPQGFVDNHGHALVEGEEVYFAFRTIRDWIAFTDWRLIYVDVQGILGNKKEYLTVPYRSITAFSRRSNSRSASSPTPRRCKSCSPRG